ncbi:hypothetical protein NKR23_g160 [Pleurostoma richardsiae]|uniref:Uncharacterized protein n=1 Tax=Pleurostoma richardsiae TaxID=41990 RepID=A0AA38VY86_9PEZI|nr:hypothetical protein NKR23_g160 [Pleurostoma richardsiae]
MESGQIPGSSGGRPRTAPSVMGETGAATTSEQHPEILYRAADVGAGNQFSTAELRHAGFIVPSTQETNEIGNSNTGIGTWSNQQHPAVSNEHQAGHIATLNQHGYNPGYFGNLGNQHQPAVAAEHYGGHIVTFNQDPNNLGYVGDLGSQQQPAVPAEHYAGQLVTFNQQGNNPGLFGEFGSQQQPAIPAEHYGENIASNQQGNNPGYFGHLGNQQQPAIPTEHYTGEHVASNQQVNNPGHFGDLSSQQRLTVPIERYAGERVASNLQSNEAGTSTEKQQAVVTIEKQAGENVGSNQKGSSPGDGRASAGKQRPAIATAHQVGKSPTSGQKLAGSIDPALHPAKQAAEEEAASSKLTPKHVTFVDSTVTYPESSNLSAGAPPAPMASPPPPSGFGNHTQWQPVDAKTTRCDFCNNCNDGVMQKCMSCAKVVCKECLAKGEPVDGVHPTGNIQFDWTVTGKEKTARTRSRKGKNARTNFGTTEKNASIVSVSDDEVQEFLPKRVLEQADDPDDEDYIPPSASSERHGKRKRSIGDDRHSTPAPVKSSEKPSVKASAKGSNKRSAKGSVKAPTDQAISRSPNVTSFAEGGGNAYVPAQTSEAHSTMAFRGVIEDAGVAKKPRYNEAHNYPRGDAPGSELARTPRYKNSAPTPLISVPPPGASLGYSGQSVPAHGYSAPSPAGFQQYPAHSQFSSNVHPLSGPHGGPGLPTGPTIQDQHESLASDPTIGLVRENLPILPPFDTVEDVAAQESIVGRQRDFELLGMQYDQEIFALEYVRYSWMKDGDVLRRRLDADDIEGLDLLHLKIKSLFHRLPQNNIVTRWFYDMRTHIDNKSRARGPLTDDDYTI